MSKAVAFAPGHISAFFVPCFHKNVLRTGSLGAGVSISSGAIARVEIEEAEEREFLMFLDGKPARLEVTAKALEYFLGSAKVRVKAYVTPMLPLSQGFGMSAAGTLSVLLALSKILAKPYSRALVEAHRAEVVCKTGLGDVAGISVGGYEIRLRPGIPPYGFVDRIVSSRAENSLLLCILGNALETKKVLSDERLVERCASVGKKMLAKLLSKPTVKNLFDCGFEFACQTGLASAEIEECVMSLRKKGVSASMAMLGNSVFALAKGKKRNEALEILKAYGKVFSTKVWHGL